MTGYYDYVLGVIPLVLIGITAVLSGVGLQLTQAVPVGAGGAVLVIGHALFVNAPVDAPPTAKPVNAD
ncbi:hypothetical protein ACFQJD_11030 [Haloplanus sp. GCM10025708]|uniref:hypothetical protein n=1 Tax=Haloferacaceae TaxID=1644056 RepID=UPI0036185298